MKQYAYFNELPLKAAFSINGDRYIKQSTRTVKMIEHDIWFYTAMKTLCIVGPYCRLSQEYFK